MIAERKNYSIVNKGYLRREDNDSKFGSYPLHDDYSEDSNPDKFTNLDY